MRKALRIVAGIVGLLVVLIIGFVVYVQLTHVRDFSSTPLPDLKASKEPAIIAQGAYVAHALAHCSACHGAGEFVNQRKLPPNKDDMRGGYVMQAGPFGTFYPANLTPDPDTGIGKLSDSQLARVIRHGVSPTGKLAPLMAFAVGPMADEDLVALISYLRSIPPIKNPTPPDEWGFIAKALASKFNPNMAKAPKYVPAGEASVERGNYLANGPALCGGCHTPVDPMQGMKPSGPAFSGAAEPEPDRTDPNFELMAPNLTPDPETGALAQFSEDGFIARIRAGTRHAGTIMPWENFAQMTDNDLRSIFRYLKTVPPIKRKTGDSRRPKGTKVEG